jgi:short-subunit dehydrogenase
MHIVITGASSGIGESLAKHFGRQGHSLTLVARRAQALAALADSLPQAKTLVYPADLSDTSACQPLIQAAEQALGPIDVLINNAGVQYVEPAAHISGPRIRALFDVDLISPLILSHHALTLMLPRGRGAIVNIASLAGIISTPGMAHYNGAKSGLASASETMHVELAPHNIHVLTVYPGPVSTPMEAAARDSFTGSDTLVRAMPTGTADELAALIDHALAHKQRRIIYPRIYSLARYFRIISQWFTDRFTPPVQPTK